jgi:hypothetical protein
MSSPVTQPSPKQLNREKRIKIAKKWAHGLKTKKKIKAYQKYFGVDKLCAAKELTLAGVELTEKYALRWATRHERKALARKKKKKYIRQVDQFPDWDPDSDENFYYIAGHTPAGFPFGITWEQAEADGLLAEDR